MKMLTVLCIVAIVANVAMAATTDIYYYEGEDLLSGLTWEAVGGEVSTDDGKEITGLAVTVPDRKMYELAPYDYSLFIQAYWANKTTGNWSKYTIDLAGQWIDMMPGTNYAKDGFGVSHKTLRVESQLDSHFLVNFEEHDSEPVNVEGSLKNGRVAQVDLTEKIIIQSILDIDLEMSGFALIGNVPGGINFNGTLISFLDPQEPQTSKIEDLIIRNEENFIVGKTGNVTVGESWMAQTYNWSVERGVWQSDYETVQINITSSIFDWYPYEQQVWISNDVSVPVKNHVYVNNTVETNDTIYWSVVETTHTLQDGAFIEGSQDIPWGDCDSEHWRTTHELADFQPWKDQYMPRYGNAADSSMELGQDDAVAFALANSQGLQDWLANYSHDGRVIIGDSGCGIVRDDLDQLDPEKKQGNHTWELEFYYTPTDEEWEEALDEYYETEEWNQTWGYAVTVVQRIENRPVGGLDYGDLYFLEEGIDNESYGRYTMDGLRDELLTLSSAEQIMRSFPRLEEKMRINAITDDLEMLEDDFWWFSFYPLGASVSFVDDMLTSLTGLTLPTVESAYQYQQGFVGVEGESLSTSVDATTGRLVYYLSAQGTPIFTLL